MSDEGKTKSVLQAAEKARALRLSRLRASLDSRLEKNFVILAVDALLAEAGEGDPQTELWEKLHAAAARDDVEEAVADAYLRSIDGPRMRRLPRTAQADVLMHAADFFVGIRGDAATADRLLGRVLDLAPERADAFTRLEQRFEKLGDGLRLLELYGKVASSSLRRPEVLATQVLHRLLLLKDPLSDDACRNLLTLVSANAKLLDALEAHCRTTKRTALACELIERAIAEDSGATPELTAQRRSTLVELYDVEAPTKVIDSVEWLLDRDPRDAAALKLGERLLSRPEVASRAAAALAKARRARG